MIVDSLNVDNLADEIFKTLRNITFHLLSFLQSDGLLI